MEIATKVNGRAIKCMEKESIISLMAEYMKVIIKIGKRCGNGIFKFPKGNSYDGEWKDDAMHGKGV